MNVDISTNYMGFRLKNPIIAASSGLTDSVEKIKKLYQAGVGAVVIKSLFEEQIIRETDALAVNNISGTYSYIEDQFAYFTKEKNLNDYLDVIKHAKQAVDIPVFASINCATEGEWVSFAKKIQAAGADALELNVFILPADIHTTGQQIEATYNAIIKKVKQAVDIPVAVKLSSYFSGVANFMYALSESGADALVLFNRFFTPDIDIETEKVQAANRYSVPEENGNTLRWLSILSPHVQCDLAASTGIHNTETLIKNLLVGANAVQLASVLYKTDLAIVTQMLSELEKWMVSKKYSTLEQVIGKLNQKAISNPVLYERAQFMKYFSNHY